MWDYSVRGDDHFKAEAEHFDTPQGRAALADVAQEISTSFFEDGTFLGVHLRCDDGALDTCFLMVCTSVGPVSELKKKGRTPKGPRGDPQSAKQELTAPYLYDRPSGDKEVRGRGRTIVSLNRPLTVDLTVDLTRSMMMLMMTVEPIPRNLPQWVPRAGLSSVGLGARRGPLEGAQPSQP